MKKGIKKRLKREGHIYILRGSYTLKYWYLSLEDFFSSFDSRRYLYPGRGVMRGTA